MLYSLVILYINFISYSICYSEELLIPLKVSFIQDKSMVWRSLSPLLLGVTLSISLLNTACSSDSDTSVRS